MNMISEWYVGTSNRRHVGGILRGVWIAKGASRSMGYAYMKNGVKGWVSMRT